jgi:hypothetical protein
MVFTLVVVIGAFIGGGIVGAGGFAAFEASAKADVKTAWAAVEAEFAKVVPTLTTAATSAVAAVKTAVAKL